MKGRKSNLRLNKKRMVQTQIQREAMGRMTLKKERMNQKKERLNQKKEKATQKK